MEVPQVFAVVVHHDSVATVVRTLQDLVAGGVAAHRLVVVDNSGPEVDLSGLRVSLPDGAKLIEVENRGYAAAVNHALRHIDGLTDDAPAAVLVSTHDVRLPPATLAAMLAALATSDDVGAVGPTLYDADRPGRLWSAGGLLTPRLRITRHALRAVLATTEREWLDGCCVLYRGAAVRDHRLDENYFLYFEEVDFHQTLRAAGWRVVVVPETAEQSTGGTPTYYAMRNVRLFQRRWGRPGYRHVAWLSEAGRQLATLPGRDRSRASVRALVKGWRDGRRGR